MKMRACLLGLFGLLNLSDAWAQSNDYSRITSGLSKLNESEQQEKLYVHLDRTFYLTGEVLWWKAYLVNASDHRSSTLSKIGYLEILDSDNQAVSQSKIELSDGQSDGGIFLPATLNSGHYRLVGYTRWMQNRAPEFFFSQDITIVNPFRKIRKTTPPAPAYTIDLLPEGGRLVYEVPCTMAVIGVNSEGKGIPYKGALVNNANDTLARFHSLRFGLSEFKFTPKTGDFYRAVVNINGKWMDASFPAVEMRGVALHAERQENFLAVTLSSENETGTNCFLVLHHRSSVKVARVISIKSSTEKILIPYDSLGSGINHLTLFNSSMAPVNERLVFKHPTTEPLQFNLSSQKVARRSKLTLDVNSKMNTNLSISIYKVDSLDHFPKIPIDTYLHFTSDLQGKVESPEYYFENTDPDRIALLDLLMRTRGWTRFNWQEVIAGPTEKAFAPEFRGHIVEATIKNSSGAPANGVVAYVASPSKNIRVYPVISNQDGNIKLELKSFYGAKKMYLQTDYRKDSGYSFAIQSPFSKAHIPSLLPAFDVSPLRARAITERSVSMQSGAIYARTIPPPPDQDSSAFYGKPDEQYQLDDYTRFPVLEEVLREFVAGVWVRKRGSAFSFQIPDKITGKMLNGEPLVLIDGVPVFDISKLLQVDATKVSEIDVVERTYFLNGVSFDGIASFRTYAADMGGMEINPRVVALDYEGLQAKKEFYAPTYSTAADVESRIPDRRTLLLWKPNVSTHAEKPTVIDFYSSDVKGVFRIEVQGLEEGGRPVSLFKTFEVN